MHIRGGVDLFYIVEKNALSVATSALHVDWHLSLDPTAWVLVSTGRENQWRAALKGKIVGWGKRPLLPFKLWAASIQA